MLSSHILSEVAEVCDSVVFLDKGIIIAHNTMEKTTESAKIDSIRVEFLEPLNEDELATLKTIPNINNVEVENAHYLLTVDGDRTAAAAVAQRLISEGFQFYSFTPTGGTLEDVYVSIMSDERGVS